MVFVDLVFASTLVPTFDKRIIELGHAKGFLCNSFILVTCYIVKMFLQYCILILIISAFLFMYDNVMES